MKELATKTLEGEVFTSRDTVRVIGRPRPLLQEHINVELPAGHTVAELIDMACGARRSHMPVAYAAHVDGAPIPSAMQDKVRLKPGHTLTFEPRLAGESARNIAMLAVAVVALVATIFIPVLFPATSVLVASLIGAGIALGGSLAVNALFPIAPQKTPLAAISKAAQESVYTISGARNSAAPFEPVPSILGRVRVFPRYAALPFSSFDGTDQYYRMLFVVGYGPLDLSDFKIGETDVDNFEDVDMEVFEGYEDDDEPTLYTRAAFEEALSVDLSDHDGTWFERTTEANVSSIGGDILMPEGWFKVNDAGKYLGFRFRVDAQYRESGSGDSWTSMLARNEEDFKKRQPYRFGFKADVPQGEAIAYDVRVRSTSTVPDEDEFQVANTLGWITLRAFRPGRPIRFGKPLAKVALRIKASGQLNSVIDTFNLIAQSKVNSFNGSNWDGDDPDNWDNSRNPADLIRHVLQGPAIYQAQPDAQIDEDALEGFWEYCDDEGWEYNREHAFTGSVFETLQTIAAAGRGRITRTDGKWGVIWDEANIPVAQHFSHRNSWDFQELRVYINPPHAYRCPFVNEQKNWAADERIVYADDYDEDNATLFETIEFPGVTDPDKIWRLARFQMAQTLLRPSTYTLMTNWQALSCTVGSRVYVNHDVAEWGIATGRVVNASGDSIVLDEEVTLQLGFNYLIRFRQADGTSVTRAVTVPQVGATKRLVLKASASPDPEVGDLVMFGNDVGGAAVLLRVRDIEWLPDLNARLTLVDDAPDIADADEGDIPAYDSQVTAPTNVYLRQPYNLVVVSQTYLVGSVPEIRALINWNALAVDVQAFEVEMRNDNLADPIWEKLITVGPETLSAEALDLEPGNYSFRVRSVFGRKIGWSAWTQLLGVTLTSDITVPPDVTNFRITNLGDMALLSWDAVAAPNISHYVIRQTNQTTGVSWGTASILFDRVIGLSVPAPPLTGTYLIKAVNYSGLESANPATIISNAVNLRDLNVVLALDPAGESPPWPGTLTNLSVDGTELVLDGNAGEVIDPALGTNIGNMTEFGGLAAAFDGDADELATDCASRSGANSGYVGKTLAIPKAIARAVTYASSNSGYTSLPNFVLRLFGKQGTAPASALDGTELGSVTGADVNSANPQTITSSDTETEWDHVWCVVTNDLAASGTHRLAELELYAFGDAVGLYATAEIADLGDVYTSRISVSLNAFGDNVANFIAAWLTLASVNELSGAQDAEWAIRIEERHTSDDPTGSPAAVWTEWTELVVTDISARAFEFRMFLYSFNPDVDVRVVSAIISIDMPDRIEGIGDFVVSDTGTPHVSFSVPFKFLETVLVTAIQGASTGDYADVTNRDEEGFDIMVFDSADARVARTVDILAVGYGKAIV